MSDDKDALIYLADVRIDELEAENTKLRKMNSTMWLIIMCASAHTSAEDGLPVIHEDDIDMLRSMRRELGWTNEPVQSDD